MELLNGNEFEKDILELLIFGEILTVILKNFSLKIRTIHLTEN